MYSSGMTPWTQGGGTAPTSNLGGGDDGKVAAPTKSMSYSGGGGEDFERKGKQSAEDPSSRRRRSVVFNGTWRMGSGKSLQAPGCQVHWHKHCELCAVCALHSLKMHCKY